MFEAAFKGAVVLGARGEDSAAALEAGEDPAARILGYDYGAYKDLDESTAAPAVGREEAQ